MNHWSIVHMERYKEVMLAILVQLPGTKRLWVLSSLVALDHAPQ